MPLDTSSHARPEIARVTHVSLDLTADFERKVMRGKATLSIVARDDAAEIVLDSLNLVIHRVRAGGAETTFTLGESRPSLGAPLTIALNGARTIEIEYESGPDAASLQWLTPAQTASNKHFLFSQGQSILNRTWMPTQDSPGIRQTYDARIVAPEGLKVVMSAEMLTPDGEAGRRRTARVPLPHAATDPALSHRHRRRRSRPFAPPVHALACGPSRAWLNAAPTNASTWSA